MCCSCLCIVSSLKYGYWIMDYAKFSVQGARPILHENSIKCLCGVLLIIHEIYMWFNGYFTSSAIVVVCHRPRPPPSSVSMSKIRTSAFYPLHLQISSAKFICNLPVATSIYPHICILSLAVT